MKQHAKPRNCPSRLKDLPLIAAFEGLTRGYAFLILMMVVTLLLISFTASLPSIYQEGQREKEEELIFRGNEYARAIMFFHRQFGRYPGNVDELIKKTNGFRFLRHEYRDPMSATGKWRLIHATAQGVVLDSKTMPLSAPPGTQAGQNPQSLQNGQPSGGLPVAGQITGGTSGQAQDENSGDKSSPFVNSMPGAFIVGVASTSPKASIRVWNNQTHYSDWEFLAVGQGVGGALPGQTAMPAVPGQNPGVGPGGAGGFGGRPPLPHLPPLSNPPPQSP